MILINLLPHREEKRRLRKQAFFVGLGLSAVAGAVIVALWYAVLQQMTASQMDRNEFLRGAISKLDEEIKDVSSLKGEIEALKARQRAVEDLQTDRNMPVYLLNELVRQTPEGVYLTAIRQDGQTVLVSGQAQTNERVAEFLRNTSASSQWLERADLQEIKAAVVGAGREQAPVRLLHAREPASAAGCERGSSRCRSGIGCCCGVCTGCRCTGPQRLHGRVILR